MSGWIAFAAFPVALVIGGVVVRYTDRAYVAAGLAVVGLLFGLANGCGYRPALKNSEQTKTLYVNHKERTGGDNGKWLVFTNHGVYSVEDSFWLWKFDASDRYNRIHVGSTYRCEMAGWRIHFDSDYQNLIACERAA